MNKPPYPDRRCEEAMCVVEKVSKEYYVKGYLDALDDVEINVGFGCKYQQYYKLQICKIIDKLNKRFLK